MCATLQWEQLPYLGSPLHQRQGSECGGASVVAVAAFVLLGLLTHTAMVQGSTSFALSTQGDAKVAIEFANSHPEATQNASYCGLLGAGNGLDSTNYTTNVTDIWSQLCILPSFQVLIKSWGGLLLHFANNGTNGTWVAANLTFQYGGTSGAPPTISFVTLWISGCINGSTGRGICSHMEYWNGNVTTNSLTGPFITESQLARAEPPDGGATILSIEDLALISASVAILMGAAALLALRASGKPRVNSTIGVEPRYAGSEATPHIPEPRIISESNVKPHPADPHGEDRLDDML
jgi:hypothetical protein